MKLDAESVAIHKRLVWKVAAFGEQIRTEGKLESFAVPVIDVVRPMRTQRKAGLGRADRIIADLRAAFRMRRHARAEMHGEHLGAEADAEERPLLPERHADPVDLAPDVVVRVVRAHRTAEDHGACVFVKRLRQQVAEPRTADVQAIPKLPKHIADTAGLRAFLMQDDQDGPRPRRRICIGGGAVHSELQRY